MPKKKEASVTDVQIVAVAQEKGITPFVSSFKVLMKEAKDFKIVDDVSNVRATAIIRDLELLGCQFKRFRESLYKPIKDFIKGMEAKITPYEKTIKDTVGDWQTGIRGAKSRYETERDNARRKEEERLQAEQQAKYAKEVAKADKKGAVPPPAPAPVVVVAPKEEGVSYSEKWVFEVVDFDLVPSDCKIIDDQIVNARINKGGVRTIPGLKIWCVKTPIIREEQV
jgi:hypothetical protein